MKQLFSSLLLLSFLSSSFAQGRFNLTEIKRKEYVPSLMQPSPDGTYLYGSENEQVAIWTRTPNGYVPAAPIKGFIASGESIGTLRVSNSGNLMAVTTTDDKVFVFKRTGPGAFKKIFVSTDYERDPNYISFSADDRYLAASEGIYDDESGFIVWEIKDETVTKVNQGHPGTCIRFSPADPDLAEIEGKLFKIVNGKFIPFSGFVDEDGDTDRYIYKYNRAFSPSGEYFAGIGDYEGAPLYVWRKKNDGRYKLIAFNKEAPKIDAKGFAISPDNRYIIAYDGHGYDGKKKIIVYKIEGDSVSLETELGPFSGTFDHFYFINDGKTCLGDWDAPTGGPEDALVFFKVDGVKGNALYKDKPTINTNPVVTNNPVVKNDPVKPPVTGPTNPTVINNITNIFWISPSPENLDDKPVVSESPTIEIQVKVVSNKKVTKEDIKIIINGKEQGSNKFNEVNLQENKQDEFFEYTYANAVPLEETADHINTIEIFVNGKKSSKPLKVLYSVGKPNLHVLAIGTALDLQFPQKDAKDFAELFSRQGGPEKDKLFGSVDVRTLIGKDATTNAIKESIEKYRYEFKTGAIGPRDVMLIFISSHGFIYQDQLRIQGDDFKDLYKETYSVAYNEIISRLKEVNCKKLIFLDACFSGGAKASVVDVNNAIKDLNQQGEGVTTFSSSSNDEYSYEDVKWQNGAFTFAIKEGLAQGKADKDGNGIVTINELYAFVSAKVPAIVTEVKGKPQHPTMPVNEMLGKIPVFVVGK